jgi:uncharacterized protein (TIGR02186 family)
MKQIAALVLGLFIILAPQSSMAQRTKLAAALFDEQVLLTSNFSGTKVTIFGAVEAAGDTSPDIVVLVRGPDRPAWISRKTKVLNLWVGQRRVFFDAAPTFFGAVSTRNIDDITAKDTQKLYGMTADSQVNLEPRYSKLAYAEDLKTSFIAERERQKLYLTNPKGVKIEPSGLFRADVKMPDLTPPGLYTVKVLVFKNGRPVDTNLQTFVVTKVGIERTIFEFAKKHTITYGLFGVLLALGAGFTSARVFRRFQSA